MDFVRVADRHTAGMRVLFVVDGLGPRRRPARGMRTDQSGRPVAVDPGNPTYLDRLRDMAAQLVASDGAERRRPQG